MSKLEFFEMSESGAGWTDINELPIGDVIEIEIALSQKPAVQLLCGVCLVSIPSGTGFTTCEKHRRKK
jgi:hypothetical protein